VASSFDIADRYKRATCFKTYLENQWHLSNLTAEYFDLSALLKAQEESFLSVHQFIERGKKQRRARRE
jgi:hypothetical protein